MTDSRLPRIKKLFHSPRLTRTVNLEPEDVAWLINEVERLRKIEDAVLKMPDVEGMIELRARIFLAEWIQELGEVVHANPRPEEEE